MQHPNLNPPIKSVCTTPSGASASNPVFIIETYYNSTTKEWYRKYSDGVIEQGGFAEPPSAASDASVTISFIVPYTDSNITIFITDVFNSVPPSGTYHGGIQATNIQLDSNTNKYVSFNAWWDVGTGASDGCFWRAVGK